MEIEPIPDVVWIPLVRGLLKTHETERNDIQNYSREVGSTVSVGRYPQSKKSLSQ